VETELRIMLPALLQNKERIARYRDQLMPDIRWDGHHRKSQFLEESAPAR